MLLNLQPEIMLLVLENLPWHDLVKTSQTSRTLKAVCENNRLWYSIYRTEISANNEKGAVYNSDIDYKTSFRQERMIYGSTIAAGSMQSIGISGDGTVIEREYNEVRTISPPKGRKIVRVSIGQFHSLGLLDDGSVMGWGSNGCCEAPRLVKFPTGKKIIQISGGYKHTLCLLNDGTVAQWGMIGKHIHKSPHITNPPKGKKFIQVAAGNSAYGLLNDGTVMYWENAYSNEIIKVPGKIEQISAGDGGLFILSGGSVMTCYMDVHWRVRCLHRPNGRVVQIASEFWASSYLLADGTVRAWQNCDYSDISLAKFPPGRKVVQIALGNAHFIGLLDDGTIVGQGIEPLPGKFVSPRR